MIKYLLLFLVSGYCQAQLGWDLLASTKIKNGIDPFLNEEIELPDFPRQVLEMEGQEIMLEGFIIPLKQASEQAYFVLSRYPYQSCFFCGAAGPESVVEVYANRKFKYTDEQVRVTGTLHLNRNDSMRLFFILKDCSVESL